VYPETSLVSEANVMKSIQRFAAIAILAIVTVSSAFNLSIGAAYAADPASKLAHSTLDTTHITADFQAAIIVHPQRVFTNPKITPAKVDAFAEKVVDGVLSPTNVDQITLLFGLTIPKDPTTEQAAVHRGLILKVNKPCDQAAFTSPFGGETIESRLLNGKTIWVSSRGDYNCTGFPDDRTVLKASTPELLIAMWSARSVSSPLIEQLGKIDANRDIVAAASMEPLREGLEFFFESKRLPEPFQAVNDFPGQLRSASGWIDLSDETLAEFRLTAYDDEKAGQVKTAAEQYLEIAKGLWINHAKQILDALSRSSGKELSAIVATTIRQFLDSPVVAREDNNVTVTWRRPRGLDGVFAALPAEVKRIEAIVELNHRINKLSAIGKALQVSRAINRALLKPAIYDKEGKPLLSWRVSVLRYLDKKLYEKFRLDEPWDSEHNKKLIAEMPRVFAPPHVTGSERSNGLTRYLAVVGEATAFPPGAKPVVEEISDGDGNTILVVEVGPDKAVVWTKPDEYVLDPDVPKKGLGEISKPGILVLFANNWVLPIRAEIDANVLAALFTIAGGETLDPEEYQVIPLR
jgi:hypothetical protein